MDERRRVCVSVRVWDHMRPSTTLFPSSSVCASSPTAARRCLFYCLILFVYYVLLVLWHHTPSNIPPPTCSTMYPSDTLSSGTPSDYWWLTTYSFGTSSRGFPIPSPSIHWLPTPANFLNPALASSVIAHRHCSIYTHVTSSPPPRCLLKAAHQATHFVAKPSCSFDSPLENSSIPATSSM